MTQFSVSEPAPAFQQNSPRNAILCRNIIYKYSNLLAREALSRYMTALAQSLQTDNPISQAIETGFDILGPVSKQKLFERLRNKYGIEIWSATPEDLQQIKSAIIDLFGEQAGDLLMNIIYSEIDKV